MIGLGYTLSGMFYFSWVIPGAVLVGVVAVLYLRFVWSLARPTRAGFVATAVLFLGGALGMEMIGAWQASSHGMDSLTYALLATCEEFLEMASIVVFIHTLLAHLRAMAPLSVLNIAGAEPSRVTTTSLILTEHP